jgi:hypothetical protein
MWVAVQVQGLLQLPHWLTNLPLRLLRLLPPCPQASLSQVSSLSGGRGINLLQELAAVLRRALTQQAPVREALYRGLLQVRWQPCCAAASV